ncbi:MAG: sulfotransferase [Woeseiaceae bacterium]|nr:sulfotransferase [Woeseiaceae bacterium]
MVDGTMELHNILALAQRLGGRAVNEAPRYPQILAELGDDYFKRFGEQFIDDTRIYRGNAPFFIDKMPNNFMHVGLIRLILPRAKIIDARRHPLACCFSGFKQLFGEGQDFTYGLESVGRYYRDYVRLMDHWDEVLPGFVLRVRHENVVDNLETEVRRLLDFCGLPFEGSCLDFHRSNRIVRTPSSEQVRQPIYRSGLDHWRHYEDWLGPLKTALGADVRRRFDIDDGA